EHIPRGLTVRRGGLSPSLTKTSGTTRRTGRLGPGGPPRPTPPRAVRPPPSAAEGCPDASGDAPGRPAHSGHAARRRAAAALRAGGITPPTIERRDIHDAASDETRGAGRRAHGSVRRSRGRPPRDGSDLRGVHGPGAARAAARDVVAAGRP